MLNVHVRMPAILTTQQEIDQWLDFGRYDTEKVLPLLVSHNDIQMYRVTPSVGSTKTNDMNNIRPFIADQNNKTISPNRNTLDSFIIKGKSSVEPTSKNDNIKKTKKTPTKRGQSSIEDYMFKDTKPSGKRFKK
ncbi:unnamed protein product [Adineta steineri]|nr:unnamed protein product [Adineta steineri]